MKYSIDFSIAAKGAVPAIDCRHYWFIRACRNCGRHSYTVWDNCNGDGARGLHMQKIMMQSTYMADTIGLAILAVLVGLGAFFVPNAKVPLWMWAFIYVIWLLCALFIWHHPRAPERPRTWLVVAVGTVIGAPIWYGFAALAALVFYSGSEPGLSKTFDLIMTLMLAPGLTCIALTGWVRASMLGQKSGK